MSQDITFIECKKIRFQYGKKGLATAVLDQLYDSISKEGLFNPIVVRPDPTASGYYHIVQGRLRYYVVSKMMKEEAIACRVFADMSEEEAELAEMSENACRKNAKQTERLLMLRKWQETYRKHFPHLEGKKASGKSRWAESTKAKSKQKAVDEEKAADEKVESTEGVMPILGIAQDDEATVGVVSDVEAEHESAVESGRAALAHQTFRDRVKAVTGISNSTLSRELFITNNLTEEQLYCLDAIQCTKQQMTKIIESTPGDEAKRAEIVALVCSGIDVKRAIADVIGNTTATEAGEQPKAATAEAKPEPKVETEDEWFLRECGEFSGFLGDTDQYKSDAILWHRIAEKRTKFRKEIKKIIEKYQKDRKGKRLGRFFWSLYRVINVSHPNYWAICPKCSGSSMVDPGDLCPKCGGACYELKTERY
jgi:hypothetical protein